MKFKSIINEMSQIEYSDENGVQQNDKESNALEASITRAIGKAIQASDELRKKFKMNQLPYDIQVVKEGSTFKITMSPEDGSDPSIRVYPMNYLAKYINNPKMMAVVLLER